MSTTQPTAPAPESNPYGTETDPDLQRDDYQRLGLLVVGIRDEFELAPVMDNLWLSRKRQSFADLARTALAVAADRTFTDPSAIHMVAAGVIQL